jgi:hypothetical protein
MAESKGADFERIEGFTSFGAAHRSPCRPQRGRFDQPAGFLSDHFEDAGLNVLKAQSNWGGF